MPTLMKVEVSLRLEEKTAFKTIRALEELLDLKIHNLKTFFLLARFSDHWRQSNTCQIFV